MQFSSIQPIDRTLSSATTLDQSGPGSNGNEGVLRIPQSSSITGTPTSDCLVSYPGHSFGRVLPLCRDAVCVFYNPSRLGKASLSQKECKFASYPGLLSALCIRYHKLIT